MMNSLEIIASCDIQGPDIRSAFTGPLILWCSNYDPGLNLTYLMARSNFAAWKM